MYLTTMLKSKSAHFFFSAFFQLRRDDIENRGTNTTWFIFQGDFRIPETITFRYANTLYMVQGD